MSWVLDPSFNLTIVRQGVVIGQTTSRVVKSPGRSGGTVPLSRNKFLVRMIKFLLTLYKT